MLKQNFTHKFLGPCTYKEGLETHAEGPVSTIFGFEHPSTITLGIRAKAHDDLLCSEHELKQKGIALFVTDRGGHATLHNPGQLVIYPKLHLPAEGLSVRDLVCLLQKATVAMLHGYGILADIGVGSEPGVFVGDKKIAALGLRIKKGTAHHGLAINIKNDLEEFRLIRSCGIANASLTSMLAEGVSAELKKVFFAWVQAFEKEISLTRAGRNSTLATDLSRV